MRTSSLSNRLQIYFGSLIAALLSVLGLLWYYGADSLDLKGAHEQAVESAVSTLEISANFQHAAIRQGLKEVRGYVLTLAENKVLAKALENPDAIVQPEIDRIFDRAGRAYPDRYRKLVLVDPLSGRVRASSEAAEVGQTFAHREFLQRASEVGMVELLEHRAIPSAPRDLMISRQIHAPDADGYPAGTLVGILMAYVSFDNLMARDDVQTLDHERGMRYTLLLDSAGKVMARSYPAGSVDESFLADLAAVAEGFEGTLTLRAGAVDEMVAVFRYVPLNVIEGWRLVHVQSSRSMLGSLLAGLNTLLVAGAMLSLLALGLVGWMARRIAQPFEVLTAAARDLGQGNYNARVPELSTSNREFHAMADAFNGMADAVARTHEELEQRVALRTNELLSERDQAQSYLDIAGVMILALNDKCRVELINRKGCELLGRREDEILGRDWCEVFVPEAQRAAVRAVYGDLMAGKSELSAYYENHVLVGNGSERLFAWHNVLLRDAAGKPIGTLSSAEDITERRQAELELEQHRRHLERLVEERTADLEQARQAAEAASMAKSQFLANMSHELRTPLNGIMGMTGIALNRTQDPRVIDPLGKAKRASEHLLGVINDILDISKIEADHMELERIVFRLGEVFENLASMVRHRAEEKGLAFSIDVPADLAGQLVKGDPLRLGQILLNLASNAVKFTPAGSVSIRAFRTESPGNGPGLCVEVRDTGIGIDPKDQKRLFMSFEQADGSMTRRYGGTGLGLAISKRLAGLMGGSLDVSSQPGQGSTFRVLLPLEPCAATDLTQAEAEVCDAEQRLKAEHAGARILLAEDEPISREVARELLEDAGLEPDLAEDGAAALELARKFRYDLILMDMQMPRMNGVEAVRSIRARSVNRETPVVAMTANAFDGDRKACLDAGMNDHLGKPVRPTEFYATILRWMERSQP